jgi:hypothetical protein
MTHNDAHQPRGEAASAGGVCSAATSFKSVRLLAATHVPKSEYF